MVEGWKKGGWMAGWMVGGARACLTAHIPLGEGGGEGRGAGLALRPARTRAAEQQEEEEEEESNPRRCRGPSGEEGRDYYCIYIYIYRVAAYALHIGNTGIHTGSPSPSPLFLSLLLVTSRAFRLPVFEEEEEEEEDSGSWLASTTSCALILGRLSKRRERGRVIR